MNRRNFLGTSGKQLAVLGLAGLSNASAIISNSTGSQTVKDKSKMLYRVLGKTGIKLPVVSMGVMNANNPGLIKAAWDEGIRHFDTAWYYQNGNNEKMVGSVLREIKADRSEVVIATKIYLEGGITGKEAKDLFLKRFDESMARLQMDYVDILYYHNPPGLEQINDPYIMEAITLLKRKKRIRFSGFSTHSDWPSVITDAAGRKFYDVILLSYNYSMFSDPGFNEAIKTAYDAGIGLIAMKTQCQQDWYKRNLSPEQQKYYGESNMNTALLKWALKNEHITTAIPGFTSYDQIKEDMPVAYDMTFTREEEEFFRSKDVQLAIRSVCRHCGKCIATCPQNADIPSLMRTHMYSVSYGNPLLARQTLSQIEPGKGLAACSGCNICTSQCQFRVPIADRITELLEIYT
jgi:predicted aldo/keto reductase-like oxidoreductase